jgi:diadenosine tetraphosphate (Ap4A) HIT family hydrolase
MQTDPRVLSARAGTNPTLICKVPSGWALMCDLQFLHGYCILQADPTVESLNTLDDPQRARFLLDMALIGDAIQEVTGAYRVNYFIGGNTDPLLHAHIVPRYLSEPEELRKGLPWSYPAVHDPSAAFDLERDRKLITALKTVIQKRLAS